MTDFSLPVAIQRYKETCEAAVDALGTRAQVAELLGLDESTLSRHLNLNRPDCMLSGAHAMRLEKLSKRSIFAAAFASLSGKRVVSDDETALSGSNDVVDHLVSIAKEGSEAVGALAKVRAQPTPANANAAIKELRESNKANETAIDVMTAIAAGVRS